jgi:arylsulfatase A-like enzyme
VSAGARRARWLSWPVLLAGLALASAVFVLYPALRLGVVSFGAAPHDVVPIRNIDREVNLFRRNEWVLGGWIHNIAVGQVVGLHYHPVRPEMVAILRGRAKVRGLRRTPDGPRPREEILGPGNIVFSPAPGVHGYENVGDEPLWCLAFQSPPFEGNHFLDGAPPGSDLDFFVLPWSTHGALRGEGAPGCRVRGPHRALPPRARAPAPRPGPSARARARGRELDGAARGLRAADGRRQRVRGGGAHLGAGAARQLGPGGWGRGARRPRVLASDVRPLALGARDPEVVGVAPRLLVGPPRGRELRLRSLLATSLACAFGVVVAQAAGLAAFGLGFDGCYVAVVACLGVAAALAVGGGLALLGASPALAIALWLTVHSALRLPVGVATGAVALLYGGVVLVLLRPRAIGRAGPAWGWIAGVAQGASALAAAPLAVALGLARSQALWIQPLACLAVLAPCAWWIGSQRRRRGLSLALGACVLLPLVGRPSLQAFGPVSYGETPTAAGRPNVLILIMDTVRADVLSVYGSDLDTTPALAHYLARTPGARLYPLAFAPSNWTIPSHVSLLTGLPPSVHGLHYGLLPDLRVSSILSWRFPKATSLAEQFHAAGYRTGAVVANPYLMRVSGIERGFDLWTKPTPPQALPGPGDRLRRRLLPDRFVDVRAYAPSAAAVDRVALRFLRGCEAGGCFLLVNYMEAHAPYLPPAPYAGLFSGPRGGPRRTDIRDDPATLERGRLRYAEAIRSLDAELGRLLEHLSDRGLLAKSWLILTADHGEAFGEHGVVWHGSSLHNEQIRIPLVIQPPDGTVLPPASGPVDLLDVHATLADLVGGDDAGEGRDLRASPLPDRTVTSEFYGRDLPGDVETIGPLVAMPAVAAIWGEKKLMRTGERFELYDLHDDLREAHDLARVRPGEVAALTPELPELAASDGEPAPEAGEVDPEAVEMLRALGYVH